MPNEINLLEYAGHIIIIIIIIIIIVIIRQSLPYCNAMLHSQTMLSQNLYNTYINLHKVGGGRVGTISTCTPLVVMKD